MGAAATHTPPRRASAGRALSAVREEAEKREILRALRYTKGSRTLAARLLGVSRKTLWKKLKRLGIARRSVTKR